MTTTRPRSATSAPAVPAVAEPSVAGSVVLYRLYDVGYEIQLDQAQDLLGLPRGERGSLRPPGPPRAESQAIRIENPPITISLAAERVTLSSDRVARSAQVSARIFDFGVVSLRVRVATPGMLAWQAYSALGNALALAPEIQAVFDRHLRDLTTRIRPAVVRPEIATIVEDYVVYRIDRLTDAAGTALPPSSLRDVDVVPLLLDESRPLSAEARQELLPYWFSYYVDDLAILTWNNALVVEPLGSDSDVELVLEFANAQLLELRYYDALLDGELPRMYDRIASARRGRGRWIFGHSYADLLAAIQTLVADSTEIVERAENSLKVTDDVYLARVHAAALDLFRGRAWRRGLDHKLAIIRQAYGMLNAEAMARRSELLEGVIILLIAIEIVLALVVGRH